MILIFYNNSNKLSPVLNSNNEYFTLRNWNAIRWNIENLLKNVGIFNCHTRFRLVANEGPMIEISHHIFIIVDIIKVIFICIAKVCLPGAILCKHKFFTKNRRASSLNVLIPMLEHEIIIHYFINHSEVVISETQEIGWTNSDCWSGTFNLS